MKIRIYYEDTDINGIAYHTAYLRFCERDRSEAFFRVGLNPFDGDSFFVVKNLNADFRASVTLGDEIEVKTSMLSFRKSSFVLLQNIFCADTDKLIFSMEVTIVHLSNNKISKIPAKYVNMLEGL